MLLETFFENLTLRGLFFQKTLIIVNDFRIQAPISRKWLQFLEHDDRLACLWNVGFPSVPLEYSVIHQAHLWILNAQKSLIPCKNNLWGNNISITVGSSKYAMYTLYLCNLCIFKMSNCVPGRLCTVVATISEINSKHSSHKIDRGALVCLLCLFQLLLLYCIGLHCVLYINSEGN